LDHVISFPAAYHDVRTDGNGRPRRESIGEVYTLNSGLVHWAYELTRSIRLADNEKAQRDRARYHGSSRALAGPEVLMGATLSSSTYWHGKLLNQGLTTGSNSWTDGKGEYYTTAMEANLVKADKRLCLPGNCWS
jgi:purine nucleoside permease